MPIANEVFPLPLKADFVGNGRWRLTAPFKYINLPDMYSIPTNFVSDGASIPRLAWPLIGGPWTGKYPKAAVVHDYLVKSGIVMRPKADRVFFEAMKVLGVNSFKRWLMYRAVCAMTSFLTLKKHLKKLFSK